MDNHAIAAVLSEIADLLEIEGGNVFRIRSYRLSAESVEHHGESMAQMLEEGRDLQELEGVGPGIAAKIRELVTTGGCEEHRSLGDRVPRGLLELLRIPGMGYKGVALVWRRLGVCSLDGLEAAIADGRFRSLPGMKEKKEARILKGIGRLKEKTAAIDPSGPSR